MKYYLFSFIFGLLLTTGLGALAGPPTTTIYLVRHGEKDPTPGITDPALTPAGEMRAQTLAKKLAGKHPTVLFTTDTRRTRATLAPLAQATGLTPLTYNAKEPAALATRIGQEYAGKTVVVVGHSNTLLPLLTALGVAAPMQEIKDEQFDYLFKVEMQAGKPAKLTVSHYGAAPVAASASSSSGR